MRQQPLNFSLMKKIFTISLALIACSFISSSCSSVDEPEMPDNRPKTITSTSLSSNDKTFLNETPLPDSILYEFSIIADSIYYNDPYFATDSTYHSRATESSSKMIPIETDYHDNTIHRKYLSRKAKYAILRLKIPSAYQMAGQYILFQTTKKTLNGILMKNFIMITYKSKDGPKYFIPF